MPDPGGPGSAWRSSRRRRRAHCAGHLNCEKQDGKYRPLYGLNKSEEGYNIPRIPEQCDGAQLCASITRGTIEIWRSS